MQRLEGLSHQTSSKANFVESGVDFLGIPSLITPEENAIRLKVRQFVDREVATQMHSSIEEAKFPEFLIPKIQEADFLKYFFKAPYGTPISNCGLGMVVAELARGDASVATFLLVQTVLLGYTIQTLGSEQQKKELIPKIIKLEKIGGWGLTEEKVGSDASNLQTSVEKNDSGFKLNGNKRWIGNGDRDFLIVWARNTENKKVQGYIVDNNLKGVNSKVIKNKLALRSVQNCHITFDNVQLLPSSKLPKATSFATGTNVILKHSRVFVCWVAAGICMGVYDNAIKYVTTRKQFGQPIANFQLVQEKMVKIMSNLQAVLLSCWRVSKLMDEKNVSIGQIAMVKAFVTQRGREICKWGREVYGGNGIILDNYAMKAFVDMEAIYTYEGSYDINTLVAGRQITGLSAFRK